MLQLIANVNGERRAWPLEGEALGIGRSSRNTVQIADPTVSKEHAMLVRAGDGWSIRDLGSRNGTRVNGAEAREALPVRDGDTLEIGKVIVRVGSAEETPETRFSTSVGLSSSVRILAREVLAAPRAMTGAGSPVMKVLADAARMLVLPKPLRETCEEVLGFVEQAIPATRFVILLREPGGGEPVQIASRVRGGNPNEPLAISRKILDTVLEDCTSVITADAAQDPRFEARESIIAMAIHSAMAVPLFDNEAVLGVLYADSRDFRLSFGP